jgi:hypothetical protein
MIEKANGEARRSPNAAIKHLLLPFLAYHLTAEGSRDENENAVVTLPFIERGNLKFPGATQVSGKAKREIRVSTSVRRARPENPQARLIKQSDKGFALSYNAQISTDAAHGLIVGVAAGWMTIHASLGLLLLGRIYKKHLMF